jgi:BNR/Asp-box repeat
VISQRVQAALVVMFVLVIAGVVAMLLMRADSDTPAGTGPSAGSGDGPELTNEGPVGRFSLMAGDSDLVVRVTAGACDAEGGSRLELSENRGRSFHEILVPQVDDGSGVSAVSPKVRAIVFAEARSRLAMTVGAADATCDIHRYTTSDGGVSWEQESGALEEWYLDPRTGAVVAPDGRPSDVGCSGVVALAPVKKSTAKAVCKNGTIRATTDRGDTWLVAGELPGTSAAVFTGTLTGYAAVEKEACKSRIHVTVDGGRTWVPRGCVVEDFAMVGLAGTDGRLVAGAPSGTRLSTDGGTTWKPSTMK